MSLEAKTAPAPSGDGVTRTTAPPRPRGPRRLSMSVINFALDAMLLLIFEAIGVVAVTLRFIFPVPTDADGWTLWGLTFNQWFDVQFALLCLFAMAVVLHVMLHWNWVCSVLTAQILRTREKLDDGMQTVYGVGTLIVLFHVIVIGVIAALYGVHRPPH